MTDAGGGVPTVGNGDETGGIELCAGGRAGRLVGGNDGDTNGDACGNGGGNDGGSGGDVVTGAAAGGRDDGGEDIACNKVRFYIGVWYYLRSLTAYSKYRITERRP